MVEIALRKAKPVTIFPDHVEILRELDQEEEEEFEILPPQETDNNNWEFTRLFRIAAVLQRILDSISYNLSHFFPTELSYNNMQRNIFRIPNPGGAPLPRESYPRDARLVALSEGDNRSVEEILRDVQQSVVVNVNMSYYFKIMLVMLTLNTFILIKWILWDYFSFLSQWD